MSTTTIICPIEAQFSAAMAEYGLSPSEVIADGKLHRFAADDDKRGKKSGWYVLHGDGVPAGAFGNYKNDLSEKWCGKSGAALTTIERDAYQKRIQQARVDAEIERQALQSQAATDCKKILDNALDATDDNPYCQRKGIKPYGLKEFKDKRTLIVPIRDASGTVTSLQFIDANGDKRFKSNGRIQGCYYSFGGKPIDTLLVCEGFATGASLHQVSGYPVAVAFNAGNLEAVAKALRAKLPEIQIIICADNDRFNQAGNVGVTKAAVAARAVGGLLVLPVFRSDDGQPTDFNDLHRLEGAEEVQRSIENAISAKNTQIGMQQNGWTNQTLPFNASDLPLTRIVNLRCGNMITPLSITWLWDGWLPAGKLTILAGTAGTGKTTLALGLAAALTSGGRWPDGEHCNQRGNVLIWSSEDNPDDTLVPRLIASGADMSRCFFIEGIMQDGESMPFDPAQDIHELHKAVEKIGGVSLLIVDPIVSAVSGDMHRANDVRRSLQAVVDFAEVHGCAVIGITHFAKGGAGKLPQDRVIGSQAFGALARMVLVAAKEEDGDRRVLARAKSNIAPDTGGVSYGLNLTTIEGNIEATHVVWEGVIEGTAREILGEVEHDESDDGSEKADAESFLQDLLSAGAIPTKQIKSDADGAGYSWATIRRAQKSLGIEATRDGFGKNGVWAWHLPSKVLNNSKGAHTNNVSTYGENEHLCKSIVKKIDKKPEETALISVDSCVSSDSSTDISTIEVVI